MRPYSHSHALQQREIQRMLANKHELLLNNARM